MCFQKKLLFFSPSENLSQEQMYNIDETSLTVVQKIFVMDHKAYCFGVIMSDGGWVDIQVTCIMGGCVGYHVGCFVIGKSFSFSIWKKQSTWTSECKVQGSNPHRWHLINSIKVTCKQAYKNWKIKFLIKQTNHFQYSWSGHLW